ncbi:unnamed protein product [Mytilus coruscus]|uniref:SWIM-type domain-containing protein n=1 Tax=Mytilus coruscus TaxID=42192 RepID=A0A6J8C9C7_MYTCO|nr:unnamed protein product [Mytilus coruscus]
MHFTQTAINHRNTVKAEDEHIDPGFLEGTILKGKTRTEKNQEAKRCARAYETNNLVRHNLKDTEKKAYIKTKINLEQQIKMIKQNLITKRKESDTNVLNNVFTIRYEDPQKGTLPSVPYDEIPFSICGRKILEGHQGKDRKKKTKEKQLIIRNSQTDHDFKKRRNLIQATKKKVCPAIIRIRHIVKFIDYKLEVSTPYNREKTSAIIHNAVDKREAIEYQHVFLVSFPDISLHNHLDGEMKLILGVFVIQVLFKDRGVPSKIKSRFWPTLKDIRNHILLALREIRNNNVDQKIVEEQVERWKSEQPEDSFLLRQKQEEISAEASNCTIDLDEESGILFSSKAATAFYGDKPKLLYVHQRQRRLLMRYWNEITSFVMETEDQASIIEALSILKSWNPEWKPQYFMSDYAEEEISALENVFQGSFVYLCDFHREQSWERWLSTSHNGLTAEKENVLPLLRALARSSTIAEYQDSLSKLQTWVQAYRHNRFNVSVNTNNGVERQNKTLKYEYLQQKKSSTLRHLLSVIVDNFLPDSYKKYLQLNVSALNQHKTYAAEIPVFLHNRPRPTVDLCYKRLIDSQRLEKDDIDEIGEGLFLVKSESDKNQVYVINFNPDDAMLPSCSCISWRRTHLPCKHFFAVFCHYESW